MDEVEIVPLDGRPWQRVSRFHRKRVYVGSITASGSDAAQIADLWRALPPPPAVAACHHPPFALRFFRGEELVLEASVCWACNNVYGFSQTISFSFSFDGQSDVARRLLARLDGLCPGRTTR